MRIQLFNRAPRVLVATPAVTFLPLGAGHLQDVLPRESGHPADLTAAFVSDLVREGIDVHVAFPHYRRMFQPELAAIVAEEMNRLRAILPPSRIHPAQDRAFYYRDDEAGHGPDALRLSLLFQREVAQRIVPLIRPQVLHCGDWMTALLPAAARAIGLPSVFTLHHLHSRAATLSDMEASSWDPQSFWRDLYYSHMPGDYSATRTANPADITSSGIFAADFLTVPSPTFLTELASGKTPETSDGVRREVARHQADSSAAGILSPPDSSFDPAEDPALLARYSDADHFNARRRNKTELQRVLRLPQNEDTALFFWPSRLDSAEKGCSLLTHLLPDLVRPDVGDSTQVVIIANGTHQKPFRDVVRHHYLESFVAVHDFDPRLSRLGYAAADFALIPSLIEPAGRAAMTALRYGALPIARDTGAIHDTVRHLDVARSTGNGFLFETYDSSGLRWALQQAVAYHRLPAAVRAATVARVMRESRAAFMPQSCARRYAAIYTALAERPAGSAGRAQA